MPGERVQRRLAAIVSADVVSYSKLMEQDEAGTLAQLRALRDEVLHPKIADYGGRIVKTTGDGTLIEFASAVDAVAHALDVQRILAERNAGLPEAQQIQLRFGVNLGDIIIDGDDIFGDGVNVAARVEALAEPGGICVSGTVYEHVQGKLEAEFDDLGEQTVKNIARPVRIYRVRLGAANAMPAGGAEPQAAAPQKAPAQLPGIAVLPFDNMSGDAEQDYFADGLTEDIITALTYWRSFPVIARNSTFAYKHKAVNVTQVSRELGARYILEGSVRKLGERVRVTAQLTDGTTGHHVWADRFDRELSDIFEVQDEIVQRIAAHIVPELAKAELKQGEYKRTEDLDAWDLVLRAMPAARKRTAQGNAQARELFQRAIAMRPDYSDAYAGLAMTYHGDILIGVAKDREATARLAMEAAQKAVDCDETSSWAHHELSTAYQWLNRLDDALAEARVAIELNPNDAYALHALGNKSDLAGDPGGIALMEKAQTLNPEDASRYTHLAFLARAYVNSGQYEKAVERARQAIRREPDYAAAHYILAVALEYLGRGGEAKAALARCEEIEPGFVEARWQWQPYADPASNERIHEGVRRIQAETA